jgi:hypothetical protein
MPMTPEQVKLLDDLINNTERKSSRKHTSFQG